MQETMDVWTTTAVAASAVAKDMPAAEAVAFRADILGMTQTAEDAVIRPADPGRWPHALRAALACRVARLNECPELAAHYLAAIGNSEYEELADPKSTNSPRDVQPCLEFMDRVATCPRDITGEDIKALQDAGVGDADIVRLSELNAFLAYQIRLVQGLALLAQVRS